MPKQISAKSYAKINLTLEVLKKLPSGYHNIESVFQKISLADKIIIKEIKDGIKIRCNNKKVPLGEKNICWQVVDVLQKKFNIKKGVEIIIEKNIPLEAGLGGGSSNAATTLLILNKLWDLNLSQKQMLNIAQKIGKDIPFFLYPDSTALVQGLGEKIKSFKHKTTIHMVLIKPIVSVSTSWAYNNLNLKEKKYKNISKNLINALKEKNFNQIASNLHNDFEKFVIKKYPKINFIKKELKKNGAISNLMSGSGSSVFGIFKNQESAKKGCAQLKKKYINLFLINNIK